MSMPSGSQPASGPFARAITEAIRLAMTRRRVSGAQLAERTSRSQTYISKRLRNEVPFTANDIEEICKALDEDLMKLLYAAAREMAHARKSDGPPKG
ncbi:helix-turn-helix DNA binding protein [Arthrobacter phage Peas]|uniref:Helix-turn-helix DNA binding protein n=2 Tax=Bridgettevirus TaxID=2733170 RepID=A0A3G2KIA6_9CAUD|nr:helix-turn-helix DNA binding protein [Arthrobacter phage Judy]YP_009815586.1 helix-turn-helix DNA binding protein [Arthrobacter phage Peas]AYN58110.1 helix-turn-helix DNA binding protein [Arthrobacter phage Judy]AYN58723.1 helix-turn-helix DNA binding protein [Arthrobacter phage Peas]UVK58432.1 helix-turn-helix DNA binding domain protein [Arthrobacter phage GlobiWarming]